MLLSRYISPSSPLLYCYFKISTNDKVKECYSSENSINILIYVSFSLTTMNTEVLLFCFLKWQFSASVSVPRKNKHLFSALIFTVNKNVCFALVLMRSLSVISLHRYCIIVSSWSTQLHLHWHPTPPTTEPGLHHQ